VDHSDHTYGNHAAEAVANPSQDEDQGERLEEHSLGRCMEW